MTNQTNSADHHPDRDELKQELDENLSQIVHQYERRGLTASEIVDSLCWHGEHVVSRAD